MAGITIVYTSGRFMWQYTPPEPNPYPATELRLKWGTESGNLPNVTSFGIETMGTMVKNVLPVGSIGQHYARIAAWNGVEEDPVSPEVPFELRSGGAGGTLVLDVA